MPYPKWICLFVLILVTSVVVTAQDSPPPSAPHQLPDNLVVAWVEDGSILAQTGNNAPVSLAVGANPLRPYVSRDGSHVAYLHGDNDIPSSLSVVGLADNTIHHLVAAADLAAGDDAPLNLSQVGWLDSSTIYLNTMRQLSYGQEQREDLWRINLQTDEIAMLLAPGEGGAFSFSPDRKWIVVMSAGEYDHEDAQLHLMNAKTGDVRNVLSFPAVSTGSEYSFYPEVAWQSDSGAFRVAIPDRELIYDEVNKSITLWRIPVDGSAEQIGQLSASFFGLPRWSGDGQHIVYLRRVGDPTANQFDLMLADRNGDNPIQYASGEAGSLGAPDWIPDLTEFIYAQGEPGIYWSGSPNTQPVKFPESMFAPIFLSGGQVVYASAPVSPFELHYTQPGTIQSVPIASVNNPNPIFDAVLTADN